jgi:TRAP-type C4-dicarboxylate transport system permease small subunit
MARPWPAAPSSWQGRRPAALMAWELLLFFGAPLLWGGWQLYALRRDKRAAERQAKTPDD